MKRVLKQSLLLTLTFILLCSLATGCGTISEAGKTSGTTAAAVSTTTGGTAAESTANEKELITITSLAAADASTDALTGGDLNNTPFAIELEKRTRVHIEYIMSTSEDIDTKASLLIASDSIPDIFTLPASYTGGPSKAVEDGLAIKISDYWDEYAPNYKKVLNANPEWLRNMKTDTGDVLTFSFVREDKSINVFFGPMFRKDLLDKAGLAVPETIDEWHTALVAFKDQGVKSPFTALNWFPGYSGAISGAYGINTDASKPAIGTDGKLHYGPIESGYKEYLTTMNQWFTEFLIDPDFINLNDWGVLDTKIVSGESAVTLHFLSNVTAYADMAKDTIPGFEMVAAKYPVLKKGDKPIYGQADVSTTATCIVSAKSKYIERVLEYLDYGYSEEGQLLNNFGIEGESYTLDASGNPVYTNLITDTTNSKGWTQDQSLRMYCPASALTNSVQLTSYFKQIRLLNDKAENAVAIWSEPQLSVALPSLSFTDAELEVIKNMTNVSTYVDEMKAKFITGTEPLSNFDAYVAQCKKLGIDEMMTIYNDSYERYKNR